MDSNTLTKIQNNKLLVVKLVKEIAGSTTAAVVYHFKPSFPCRVIDAALKVKTASAATAPTIAITKCVMSDISCPKDQVVTGYTGDSDVSSSAVLNIATGTATNTHVQATPGANYQTMRDIDIDDEEALKISIGQCTTNALNATLILEIQPL